MRLTSIRNYVKNHMILYSIGILLKASVAYAGDNIESRADNCDCSFRVAKASMTRLGYQISIGALELAIQKVNDHTAPESILDDLEKNMFAWQDDYLKEIDKVRECNCTFTSEPGQYSETTQ
ncbi:MAG: hypothetical protein ABIJ08_06360 [Nanoarchaeota archaeon]